MKKLILQLVTICAITFSTAQETKTSYGSSKINLGAKVGLNLATLTGDIDNNKTLTGFHIGGMAEFLLNDSFAIQPELLFSAQGTKFDSDDKIKLSYINVPIMAKYYATEGLSIEAGPQIGFLVNSEQEVEGRTFDFNNVSEIDFGLNFGLGYTLHSGLNFSARYNVGLSNIIDVDGSTEDIKNGVFQFSLGYFF